MGNSASKAASKAKPSRIPAFGQKTIGEQVAESHGRKAPQMPRASESKSEAIRMDAQDPTFAANLAQLGQVKVPGKGTASYRTDNPMLNILAERQRAEAAAEEFGYGSRTNIRNQISARTLSLLLDERKDAKTPQELDDLAREYGMQPETVAQIARFITSPSISPIELPTTDPNETPKKMAIWVDPKVSSQPQLQDQSKTL
ncbi:hypothetical protein JCM10213_009057 [Rhodosporidiobolus nylandii]